jgi:hypothetical protein
LKIFPAHLFVPGPVSSLLLDFSWKVHDDLCGSDHFPIILESLHSTVGERPTRNSNINSWWDYTKDLDKLFQSLFIGVWQFNLETKLRQEGRRFCFNVLRAFALKMVIRTSSFIKLPPRTSKMLKNPQVLEDRTLYGPPQCPSYLITVKWTEQP